MTTLGKFQIFFVDVRIIFGHNKLMVQLKCKTCSTARKKNT